MVRDNSAVVISLDKDALKCAWKKFSMGKYLAYDAPDIEAILDLEEITWGLLQLVEPDRLRY